MTKKIYCMKNKDVFELFQETAFNRIPERCIFCEHGVCREANKQTVQDYVHSMQLVFSYDNSGN